eukprot:jgi/Mesen1/6551/ME000334S05896
MSGALLTVCQVGGGGEGGVGGGGSFDVPGGGGRGRKPPRDPSEGLRKDPLFSQGGTPGDCPVPLDQQPMHEYQRLLDTWLYPWPTLGPVNFFLRLALVGAVCSAVIGWPVSSVTFSARSQLELRQGAALEPFLRCG